MNNLIRAVGTGMAVLLAPTLAFAADAAVKQQPLPVNSGDTAWILMSAAMVFLMTPGLAFFYGGLVRRKNVLSLLMQCMFMACLISVQWVVFGYSLAFGPDVKGIIGNLSWAGLNGVGLDPYPAYSSTVPHQAFMIYQAMFAIITPALIIGAFVERMKFESFVVFSLLWATFIYAPVCHWVWGDGGFLKKMGILDFAGGTVVHINAGMAALASALVLGKRLGFPNRVSPPHSLPLAVLGAGLLWFGWFGFNGGSALSAGSLATSAFVATNTAGAVAGLVWAVLDRIFSKRPTMLGIITGAVAGLAAVTPASGFVTVGGAMWIGAGSAVICFISVSFVKSKLGYDDSLDAFGVHGVGGIWGTLAAGLWATKSVNPAGADGLFYGNPAQFIIQLKATALIAVYSFAGSWLLLKLVDLVMGLRVTEQEEQIGLDLTQHREVGYTVLQ